MAKNRGESGSEPARQAVYQIVVVGAENIGGNIKLLQARIREMRSTGDLDLGASQIESNQISLGPKS